MSQVLARNIRVLREVLAISQDDLAERMSQIGHAQWTQTTVSAVERGTRKLDLDELVALSLCLERRLIHIISPAGVDGMSADPVTIAKGVPPVPALVLRKNLQETGVNDLVSWDGNRPRIAFVEDEEAPDEGQH